MFKSSVKDYQNFHQSVFPHEYGRYVKMPLNKELLFVIFFIYKKNICLYLRIKLIHITLTYQSVPYFLIITSSLESSPELG